MGLLCRNPSQTRFETATRSDTRDSLAMTQRESGGTLKPCLGVVFSQKTGEQFVDIGVLLI